ncbi:hypothetical protein SAMN02910276_02018 [Butyrivibrio sp. Su6]|uniref:hypothetical protein n=1 Tax=Butyrivibrio sp. Su6 TaxID=1520810 RepID=UPI00089F7029|nr:hypothetical protein [Butyrivibrio sp. Su6]SEG15807.1 hypothetical protein SAMN02910276_02018 [Butyrivibrio sp. Su6]
MKAYKAVVRISELFVLMIITSFIYKGCRAWLVVTDGPMFVTSPIYKYLAVGIVILALALSILWLIVGKIKFTGNGVFFLSFSVCLAFILAMQSIPNSDARACFKVAAELYDRIYTALEPGGYIDIYKNNIGLIIFEYLLMKVFGVYNYLVLQVINAVFFSMAFKLTFEYFEEKCCKIPNFSNLFVIVIMLYAPLWMTVCYAYGNMIGMSLAIIAMVLQLKYLHNDNIKYFVLSCISIAFGCFFKGIMLIVLVAMIIIYVISAFRNKRVFYVCAICMVALTLICSRSAEYVMNSISHGALRENSGTSSWAWLVMGLHIDEQGIGGWFDDYNPQVYKDNNFDATATKEESLADLKVILKDMRDNPLKYAKGISNKNYSMWLEPTFAIFQKLTTDNSFSIERHARYLESFSNDSGFVHRALLLWARLLQIAIYFGVILWIMLKGDVQKPYCYIGLIAFLGGWIFYSFWEAKSEYVLPFFTMLIPYSVMGHCTFFDKVYKTAVNIKGKTCEFGISRFQVIGSILVCISMICSKFLFNIPYTDDGYNDLIKERVYIAPGTYDCYSKADNNKLFSNIYIETSLIYDYWYMYTFVDNRKRTHETLFFADEIDSDKYDKVAIYNDHIGITDWKMLGDEDLYHWRITKENGGYVIRWWYDQNKVWTYDKSFGKVILTDYDAGNLFQVWDIR